MSETGTRNMRLAFVGNSAWSMYNFRRDVFQHFISGGYDVHVIAPDDEYSELLVAMGCTFHSVQFNNRTMNPVTDLVLYSTLKKLYTATRPAMIFHYVAKPNIYGTMAAAALGIRSVAVVTGLGYAFAQRNWLFYLLRKLYKKALSKSSEVWFLNNDDATAFVSQKIVDIRKVKILPGEGINSGFFLKNSSEKQPKEFRFLMSSRLLKSKGVGLYADAARILKMKGVNASFQLIGFFEAHHPDTITTEQLEKWQNEKLICYGGKADDVRKFLAQTDCFVFPSSYREGIPRSLLEASSMEVPIVTSNSRGCKEVVKDNETGFLCKVGDPFDLADKMEKIYKLPEDARRAMGRKGREFVKEHFGIERILKFYDRVIES